MEGKCYYCGKGINTRTAKRHIKSCVKRLEKVEESKIQSKKFKEKFILKITEKYTKDIYVLYIAIDDMASLEDLDIFIRRVWVECCNHLSSFRINNENYYSDSKMFNSQILYDDEENTYQEKLFDLLEEGTKFTYEYDFGSTTELDIEVVEVFAAGDSLPAIEILARNNPIGNSNSPRYGVCGYYGDVDNEKDYLPGNNTKLCKDVKPVEANKGDNSLAENICNFNDIYLEDDEIDIFDLNDYNKNFEEYFQEIVSKNMNKVINKVLKEASKRNINSDLKTFNMSLTKDQIKCILNNLDIRYKATDKKEKLVNLLVINHKKAYLEVFKYINNDLYDDLKYFKNKKGIVKEREINNLKTDGVLDDLGIIFTVIDEKNNFCLVMPSEILNLVEEIDELRVKKNDAISKIAKGMLYYYGVFTVGEFIELAPKELIIDYDYETLDKLFMIISNINESFIYDNKMLINEELTTLEEVNEIYYNKEIGEYKKIKDYPIIKSEKNKYIGEPHSFKSIKKYLRESFELDKDTLQEELEDMYLQYQLLSTEEFIDYVFSIFQCPDWEKDNFIEVLNKDFNKIPVWKYKGFSKGEKLNLTNTIVEKVKVGRNEPCICGSGKKFKKCCASKVI